MRSICLSLCLLVSAGVITPVEVQASTLCQVPDDSLKISNRSRFIKIARCFQRKKNYPEALKLYFQVLNLNRQLQNPKEIALDLNNIGIVYYNQKQYKLAIEKYKESNKVAKSVNNESLIRMNLTNIALAFQSLKVYKSALKYYQEAHQLLMKLYQQEEKVYERLIQSQQSNQTETKLKGIAEQLEKDTKSNKDEKQNMSEVINSLSALTKGLSKYERTQKRKKLQDMIKSMSYHHNQIGVNHTYLKNFQQSIEYYQASLNIEQHIQKEFNRDPQIGQRLYNIAHSYKSLKQYSKALAYYQQALVSQRRTKNKRKIIRTLTRIAQMFDKQSNDKQTLNAYLEVFKYEQDINIFNPNTALKMAELYKGFEQYQSSFDYYAKALNYYQRKKQEAKIADTSIYLGLLLDDWGKFDKAIQYLEQAQQILEKQNSLNKLAVLYNNKGSIYDSWGQLDKALDNYLRSLNLLKQSHFETLSGPVLNNIGTVYYKRKEFKKALEYFTLAVDFDKKNSRILKNTTRLINIAQIHSELGQHNKARQLFQKALEIDLKHNHLADVANTYNNLSTSWFESGNMEKAFNYSRKAFELNKKLNKLPALSRNLNNLGFIYHAQNRLDKAIEVFKESIALKETIRQQTNDPQIRQDYLASQIPTYRALIDLQTQKNQPEEVFQTIEQSRARVFSEQLKNFTQTQPLNLKTIKQSLPEETSILIYSNSNWSAQSQLRIDTQENSIIHTNHQSALKDIWSRYPNLLNSAQKKLGRNNRGVKLLEGKQLTGQAAKQTLNSLEALISAYRNLLTQPNATVLQEQQRKALAKTLYLLFIKPHQSALKNKKELVISPDGVLGLIPFETLIDENGKYLVESYNIRYIQSLKVRELLLQRSRTKSTKPLLAFGGAIYHSQDSQIKLTDIQTLKRQLHTQPNRSLKDIYRALGLSEWSSLPGTLSEVQEIQRLIPEAVVFSGAKVNEKLIKEMSQTGQLSQYNVLHFATHGLSVPEMPEISALVLSQIKEDQSGEDGFLRLSELAQLKLNAQFVNLSACETGLGKVYAGEGIVGLTQSVLLAGAQGVSVSLWKVDDLGTAEFMKAFYRSKISWHQRLNHIKRDFIRGKYSPKYQHPYYWAPFIFYGVAQNKVNS